MLSRALIFLAGGGLLAAATHANILETGGYGTPQSWQYIAMSIALAVCSAGVGIASAHGRHAIVIGMVGGMIAGEAFLLIKTAERAIAAREIEQAPFKQAIKHRADLLAKLKAEEAKLNADTSKRLEAALRAQEIVNKEIATQAALPGCAKNCRKLLQNRADTAALEVKAARAELKTRQSGLEQEIAQIRSSLAALPPTRSPTPLADRLGVASWLIDVIAAGLLSIGLNVLAAILFAFSGHGWNHKPASKPAAASPSVVEAPPRLKPVDDPAQHAAQYALARMQPATGQTTKLIDMITDYEAWCAAQGLECLPQGAIAVELSHLFQGQGFRGTMIKNEPHIIGIAIRA